MRRSRSQEDASLLDILIDGFEKNEVLQGFHWRQLPMPDECAAVRKFDSLVEEARRWKGEPTHSESLTNRRRCTWADLEIWQAGRGVMVRVKAPWFDEWWHERSTWESHPMDPLFDWLAEERSRSA